MNRLESPRIRLFGLIHWPEGMPTCAPPPSLVLLAIAMPASAAQWRRVFERGDFLVYVDQQSIKGSPAFSRAWLRFEFPGVEPEKDGWPAHRSSLELRRFDCASRASGVERSLVFASRDATGTPLRAPTLRSVTLEPSEPGTLGDAVLKAVCRGTD